LIACYMDESFAPSQEHGVFAVGCLLGRGVPIFELERKWEALRNRQDIGIKYFKASECERGKREFSKFVSEPKAITVAERAKLDAISREFLTLILNEQVVISGVGVRQDAFYEIIKDKSARQILGENPYRLAYDLAMIQCAWIVKELAKQIREANAVAFVCDEHEKYSPLAQEAYRALKDNNPNASEWMGTFSSADDKQCEPLQAADAIACEIRRAINVAIGRKPGPVRTQFEMLSQGRRVFLIQRAEKENLQHIVSQNAAGKPLNLDEMMNQTFEEDMRIADVIA
jgi:uncharacterized protein DUF3800